ncbi:MAG: hypothetical protein VB120_06940 [Lachnospiraceae bacterium]|nr:hypothetical protein [Lachnospiraceae bacterium]
MQEQSQKILRTKNDELYIIFFDRNTGSIVLRKYEGVRWSRPQIVVCDAEPDFSVSTSSGGDIMIINRDKYGNIILNISSDGKKWENKILFKGRNSNGRCFEKYHVYSTKDSVNIISTEYMPDEKKSKIIFNSFKEGKWNDPYEIDNFVPFSKSPLVITPINPNHVIMYYMIKEGNVISREVMLEPFEIGNTITVLSTTQLLIDISVLMTEKKVHILYTTKGINGSQVVYRNREEQKMEMPKVIWEGQWCDGVISFYVDEVLWMMWRTQNGLLYSYSEDEGISFKRPKKYRGEFCRRPIKAEYVSNFSDKLKCTELYLDSEDSYEILLVPDIYEEFYKKYTPNKVGKVSTEDEIKILKSKLESYESRIKQVDFQPTTPNGKMDEIQLQNILWNKKLEEIANQKEKFMNNKNEFK